MFLYTVVKAVAIYIVAFIAIAILIALAPIFIMFMLFEKTKDILEEWWLQLVAFSIQEVLLLASIGMFSAVIVWFMQRTLGYTVCWNVWADFDFIGINDTSDAWKNGLLKAFHLFDFRFWMPDISRDMSYIWADVNGDGVRDINEFAYRYTDLPYFSTEFDKALIAKYMTGFNFLDLGTLAVYIAAVYLMMNFMEFVPTLSNALKGGASGADSASMFGSGGRTFFGNAFTNNIFSAGKKLASGGFMTLKGSFGLGQFAASSGVGRRVSGKAQRQALAIRDSVFGRLQQGAKGIDGKISAAASAIEKNNPGLGKLGNNKAGLLTGKAGKSDIDDPTSEEYLAKQAKEKDIAYKTLFGTEVGTGLTNQDVRNTIKSLADDINTVAKVDAGDRLSGPVRRAALSGEILDFAKNLNDVNLQHIKDDEENAQRRKAADELREEPVPLATKDSVEAAKELAAKELADKEFVDKVEAAKELDAKVEAAKADAAAGKADDSVSNVDVIGRDADKPIAAENSFSRSAVEPIKPVDNLDLKLDRVTEAAAEASKAADSSTHDKPDATQEGQRASIASEAEAAKKNAEAVDAAKKAADAAAVAETLARAKKAKEAMVASLQSQIENLKKINKDNKYDAEIARLEFEIKKNQ
jgi:hypothetical protein